MSTQSSNDKKKAIENALALIDKQFGKGTVMRLGESQDMQIETISTSSISLDLALGGGVPRGRIVEVYGTESSGKTTLCQHIIAEAQKQGGMAALIDAEHAFDPIYAKKMGLDIHNLLISQPDSGEQALEIVETLVRSGAVDVIVVDSVAALTPRAEIEGDMGESHMGLQARLMSQALRKLTGIVGKTKTVVIFINQIRMKIGVMFGNPETTTGGNALKFYASVRMEMRKKSSIDQGVGDDKKSMGIRSRVKIVKNKIAPPFRQAEFDIMFSEGISKEGDILDTGVAMDIITKSGAFFSFAGTKLGQGRENAKSFLKENPALRDQIEQEIRAKGKDPELVLSVADKARQDAENLAHEEDTAA